MKKLLQKISLAIMALATVSVVTLAPAYADTTNQAKSDVCAGAAITGVDCNDKGAGLNGIIKALLTVLSIIIGIAAVIMIMLAGLRYITSGGDPSGVKGAKDSLLYAIIGLLVVALAQVIVRLVLSKA